MLNEDLHQRFPNVDKRIRLSTLNFVPSILLYEGFLRISDFLQTVCPLLRHCNNNCLVHYSYQTTVHQIFTTVIFDCFLYMQHRTRLTEFLLTVVCFDLPFYMRTLSGGETFGVSLTREFLCNLVVASVVLVAFAYFSIPFPLILVVSQLVYLQRVRCICVVYTLLLLRLFSLSIPFVLMIFVFVAFAYCFHVK